MLVVGQRRPAPRARRRLNFVPPFSADPACDQATFTTFVVRTDAGASQSVGISHAVLRPGPSSDGTLLTTLRKHVFISRSCYKHVQSVGFQ